MDQIPSAPNPFVSVDCTVSIQAPITEVFERWSRVEDFPTFMEGVREIRWHRTRSDSKPGNRRTTASFIIRPAN